MQSVLGFLKSQSDLNVVGRKLHGSLILRLSVLELRLLAIGLGARQVNGSGVRNELGCEIGLTQRGLCTTQLQVCEGESQMRFSVVRPQLQRGFKVLDRAA